MEITVVGAGTAVPQAGRAGPCYLARTERATVVVDLGPGALRGITDLAGGRLERIDAVCLTHLHMDHCADLAPLLFAFRSAEIGRSRPLTITGPTGLVSHMRSLSGVWGRWVEPLGYELVVGEWGKQWDHLEPGDLSIRAALTDHSVANLAYLLVPGAVSRGCLFTGDGKPTEDLLSLSGEGGHVLVAECSAPPGVESDGHMNPDQAGELAARCRASMLVLSHLNPSCRDEEVLSAAMGKYGGEVRVATDGMIIRI